jgi:hypothetical protein
MRKFLLAAVLAIATLGTASLSADARPWHRYWYRGYYSGYPGYCSYYPGWYGPYRAYYGPVYRYYYGPWW